MAIATGEVDLVSGQFYASKDRFDAYRRLHPHQSLFRDCNGMAAIATHAGVFDAERQPEIFPSAGRSRPDHPAMPFVIDMDASAHVRRHKLVNKGFARKGVHAKVPAIGQICDDLIEAMCERGGCDFVRDLAAPLPMAVIGDMLGVLPGDLLSWSDAMVTLGAYFAANFDEAVFNDPSRFRIRPEPEQ